MRLELVSLSLSTQSYSFLCSSAQAMTDVFSFWDMSYSHLHMSAECALPVRITQGGGSGPTFSISTVPVSGHYNESSWDNKRWLPIFVYQ